MDEEIALQLDQETTVITANRRLANYWRKEYNLWQTAQGNLTWPALDVLPLEQWLSRTWLALLPTQILLNQNQSVVIWETVIRESKEVEYLLQPYATALLVKEAWDLMRLWQVPLSALGAETSLDIQAFVNWATEYEQRCRENNWLDEIDLINSLNKSSQLSDIKFSKRILLAGFVNQIPAQIQALFSRLKNYTKIDYLHLNQLNSQVVRVECTDSESEIQSMARWAHLSLQQNPNLKIACVVPDLTNLRDNLERIFRSESVVFNISLGKPLNTYPIIQAALLILELDQPRIEISSLSQLLLSPFIGGAELEYGARALLDQRLREDNQLEIHLRKTLVLARQGIDEFNSKYHCPIWVTQIESFIQTNKSLPSLQSPEQWVKLFTQQLNALGWPGDRTLSSEEYQTVKRWQQLLDEFTQLEIVTENMSVAQAKQKLRSMAKQIIFQPESPETPIQVLGVLEAVGMQYDQLWLMGLHDQQWPAAPSPNPFIPIRIQRSLGLSQSSSINTLQHYAKLTEGFTHSAKQIILSYPKLTEDRTLRCSPLIASYPQKSLEQLNLVTVNDQFEPKLEQLEWIEDIQAPAITSTEMLKGGTKILELQAQCPFRAFAELRLDPASIKTPSLGLTPIERGALLHDVLARIWQQLQTSARLNAMNADELTAIVATQVTEVLQDFTHKKPLVFLPKFTQIEQQRLEKLILGWLEFEKQRPEFSVIATEKAVTTNIAGIDLRMRIDRIDTTPSGEKILIDYKTGTVSAHDWLEQKPLQLQLPIYAYLESQSIAALALAQIRPEHYKFTGIAESNEILPHVDDLRKNQTATKISDLITQWQQWFTELSLAFQSGFAAVAPKHQHICDNCKLQSLCRIHEEEQNDATAD